MDIVIISQYLRNIEKLEGNNSRFIYLANLLCERHSVEIITSNYMHGPKKHANCIDQSSGYKITAIGEPGYSKNVCLKRFYSHAVLAKGIKKYIEKRQKPDCIYCAVPSLDVGYMVAKFCKKNNIRFIIDIQDLWPEAFKLIFNVPLLSDLIFYPMTVQANNIYRQADEIIAVSNTYSDRAMKVNKKCKKANAVFLGTELAVFDEYKNNNVDLKKDDKDIWIGYCGTLGHSYDLTVVIDALSRLNSFDLENINIKLIVMGDGPRREEFENYAWERKINAVFTGNLEYPNMCAVLAKCDIAVNPIAHGAAQSIINKHGDYAAAGIPIINTQESKEYRALVEEYQMGINCQNGNPEDMAKEIYELIKNKKMRIIMGNNARKCAEEKFDRKRTYEKLTHIITGDYE